MTNIHASIPVTLTVVAPVFTAGDTFSRWGLDTAFYRNWRDQYAIPGSLVRGKLKEAAGELKTIARDWGFPFEEFFGRKCEETADKADSYVPIRGCLKVADFVLAESQRASVQETLRTRIRINPLCGTVDRGALVLFEEPFLPGADTDWKGNIEFFCPEDELERRKNQIKKAFLFISTVGAEKTVGFGRLKKVRFGDATISSPEAVEPENDPPELLQLSLAPEEPLMIGGVRHTTNLFKSEILMPGSVLKGAMAAGLNRICGNAKSIAEISESNRQVQRQFPVLCKWYEKLTFAQAAPCLERFVRPKTVPLSGVCYGGNYKDIAFSDEEDIYCRDLDPVEFQVDWKSFPKDLPEEYRIPNLEYHPATRTAIDEDTRRSKESQLYTFHMIKPALSGKNGEDAQPRQVYWNSFIRFPEGLEDDEERKALAAELKSAIPAALRYVGKRQCAVKPEVSSASPPNPSDKKDAKKFAVVLQTPSIMVAPEEFLDGSAELSNLRSKMREFYDGYWKDVFGESARMSTFYARQELRGGYQGMRFMKEHYRPFYLTCEGSTFVFEVADSQNAWKKIDSMRKYGLKLPPWAVEMYGSPAWKKCPYVPENGYGEVVVRLP